MRARTRTVTLNVVIAGKQSLSRGCAPIDFGRGILVSVSPTIVRRCKHARDMNGSEYRPRLVWEKAGLLYAPT